MPEETKKVTIIAQEIEIIVVRDCHHKEKI
jgi:hypothetical protein